MLVFELEGTIEGMACTNWVQFELVGLSPVRSRLPAPGRRWTAGGLVVLAVTDESLLRLGDMLRA